ncbi:hypothetical protein CRYUN_Cryun05aG0163200 [Craigia yunnanensis]
MGQSLPWETTISVGLENAKLSFVLLAIVSAALVVTIYHCVAMGWCHSHRDSQCQGAQQAQGQQHSSRHEMLEIASLENSTAQLNPAHKYKKGMGLVDDDGMCAVCLSQFEVSVELRPSPECLHSYHAPCIDMWLYSHSSWPMCRADATPSVTTNISSSSIISRFQSTGFRICASRFRGFKLRLMDVIVDFNQ